jgi:NAD(P)-dependent dehydrogenase (short-subunit alcohol dehydrogenase family)
MSTQNSGSGGKVWFITGASTGFGREMAQVALERGDRVVATARKPGALADLADAHPDAARAVRLDVTAPAEVRAALDAAYSAFGRVDVLVNNAGYGTLGGLEEFGDEQIRRQFETNFFGALDVLRAALPRMRAQEGGGHVVNVTSIGGFVGFPGSSVYCASKFALDAVSESLAAEAKHLGIKVTIVAPGAFRTKFNGAALTIAENRLPEYDPVVLPFQKWLEENDGKQPGDPRRAAEAIWDVTRAEDPPLRLFLGADAVGAAEQKLDAAKKELDAWREVGVNTAFPGAQATPIGG